MSGPGGIGEILINILPPDPLLILYGGAWNGTPTSISVDIPTDPSLAGFAAFGQGAIFDPAITYGVKIGVTDAVLFQLGA